MKTTHHFDNEVKVKHPEAQRDDWIEGILRNPTRVSQEASGTIRHWGHIQEADKYMRVVTLADGETLVTAFFDEGFTRLMKRGET